MPINIYIKPFKKIVVNVKGQLVVRDGNSRLAIAVKGKAQQIKVILETNVDQLRD
ncbi:hypothetical protein L2K25_003418 [Salmonella enterica]|uniref:Uncharacterized protein n=1 Tax=Salmonella typhimurium TaxID=90371 RepID=A0A735I4C1_SALTM|nr:hypothetical protein [Salmonella enterica]EDU4390912.1 hypothetical protein [Salmonella enterica subsp. enterica serovar Cuckmere]EDW7575517.1 hypothetical protein [Salmonella enterica subsp. enterica serovar Strathcona]EEG3305004.1 hypothetical protein [Salmonella enterica subsp. enterica serovar Stanleyville]EEI2390892.1 hypothetical protein [Salmonella enterica subsp. enterica serovar Szentes]EHS2976827.1 hypothetical protein [Salmonella enterica subsp. enterica serovar 16:l,v:- 2]EIC40